MLTLLGSDFAELFVLEIRKTEATKTLTAAAESIPLDRLVKAMPSLVKNVWPRLGLFLGLMFLSVVVTYLAMMMVLLGRGNVAVLVAWRALFPMANLCMIAFDICEVSPVSTMLAQMLVYSAWLTLMWKRPRLMWAWLLLAHCAAFAFGIWQEWRIR